MSADAAVIDSGLLNRLVEVVGEDGVTTSPAHRLVYGTDGMPITPRHPPAVVRPKSAGQVPAVVRLLAEAKVPFVARGAGTGLSGGAVPLDGAVVVSLARLRGILRIDPDRRVAVVEPGVVNAELSRVAERYGLEFAPDPSSESACTIGGNIAENSGGPHTLKHGVTRPHVLGLEVVLPDGSTLVAPSGGARLEDVLPFPPQNLPGADVVSLLTGSEGTLGIVTKAAVRLTPRPEAKATLAAYFRDGVDAVHAVTELLASGFLPASVEMVDGVGLRYVDEAFQLGVPDGSDAFLLVEVDGLREAVASEARRAEEILSARNAISVRRARDESEREHLWAARKKAFGALGRGSPNLYVHDGVVPRSRLAEMLREIRRLADEHGLATPNIFHAGDGNLHPTILFDAKDPAQLAAARALGERILELCLAKGGTLTGEHGIGREKRDLMKLLFSHEQLEIMAAVRDRWNPEGLLNPSKVLPLPVGCFEGGKGMRPGAGARDDAAGGVADRVPVTGLMTGARETGVGRASASPGDAARIHRVSADDLMVEADAGVTLGRLNAQLAESGIWVPLDSPGEMPSSIGSLLATAYTGSREARWGAARFRVLAAELRSGGRRAQVWGRGVTKNVAGYDIARTVVGSHGVLGEMTRFVLRADPYPRRRRTAIVTGPAAGLEDLSLRLARGVLPWSHVDLFSAGESETGPAWLAGGNALLVGCDGAEEESRRLERELMAMLRGGMLETVWEPTVDLEPAMQTWIWSGREPETEGVVLRVHADPLRSREVLREAVGAGPANVQLHVTSGVLRVATRTWSRALIERLRNLGCWVVVESCSEDVRLDLEADATATEERRLLEDLKTIMNPGGKGRDAAVPLVFAARIRDGQSGAA